MNRSPFVSRHTRRGDVPAEVGRTPTRVLVNTKFLDRRGMDYRSAVGQTMRISDPGEAPTGPWMEIIGVVPDLEASLGGLFSTARRWSTCPPSREACIHSPW